MYHVVDLPEFRFLRTPINNRSGIEYLQKKPVNFPRNLPLNPIEARQRSIFQKTTSYDIDDAREPAVVS